jgi:lysophospholipase L1-like esterase
MSPEPEQRQKFRGFFAFIGYLIFVVVVVLAATELAAFAIWRVYHGARPDRQEKLGSTSPEYARYAWAAEFWKEEQARRKVHLGRYVPFLIWGVTEWHGKYVNADSTPLGTLRRTVEPDNARCAGKPITTIWMFGGSTLFGSGVPDFATLASYLARDLNSKGPNCYEVSNWGAEGYDTNQEIILLEKQLKAGRHPDIAIFYDGVNDSYVGMFAPGFPEAHWDYAAIQARVEGTLAGKLEFLRNSYALRLVREMMVQHSGSRAQGAAIAESELRSKAEAVLDNYEANLRLARTLGAAYGFRVECFWQPSLAFGRKRLASYEEQLVRLDENSPEGSAFPPMGAAYEEAERRAARNGDFNFLGNILDSMSEPLYLDRWMHLGPRGNEIVADNLATYVEAKDIGDAATRQN